MGSCICSKSKKEQIYKIEEPEILNLNDNAQITINKSSKFNVSGATFINQKHFKDFKLEYEELDHIGKGKYSIKHRSFWSS